MSWRTDLRACRLWLLKRNIYKRGRYKLRNAAQQQQQQQKAGKTDGRKSGRYREDISKAGKQQDGMYIPLAYRELMTFIPDHPHNTHLPVHAGSLL